MVMPYCQVMPSIATKCLVNGHALLPPITKSRPVDQHSKVSSTTLFHSLKTKKVLKGLNPIYPEANEPIQWLVGILCPPLYLSYQEQIDEQKNTAAYYHPGIWRAEQMNTNTETDPLQPDIQM